MKTNRIPTLALSALLASQALASPNPAPAEAASPLQFPAPLDLNLALEEIQTRYSKAHPEVQEFVRLTATSFGRSGFWLNENAFAALSKEAHEAKGVYLAKLLEEGDYGRHLCNGLAEASALKDARLLPGLMKVAGYHRDDSDYDCRPKWMAVAALARQESDKAVPLLISLVDHGNKNTRMWARAALARMAGQDLEEDKAAWARWWESKGHAPVKADYLKPWKPPAKPDGEAE